MKINIYRSPGGADAGTGVSNFTDLKSGGADSVKVNKYVPQDETTIVVAMQEFASGLSNFSNYSFIDGVPHNDRPKTLREPDTVRFIVLHETSGSDSGSGFQSPYTAHFVVRGDNNTSIQQFNDLCEIEWHEAKFNNSAVGIEFVNLDWEAGSGVTKNSQKSQQLKEDDNYLWAYWGDGYNIYKIPPQDRLEQLVSLLNRLLQQGENGFINAGADWLQWVSYDDIKDIWDFADTDIPATDEEKDARNYFIFSNAIGFIIPENFTTGICSHNSVSSLIQVQAADGTNQTVIDEDAHTDGSFQAVYTWLRIDRGLSSDDAYAKTKELLRNNMFTARTHQAYEGYVLDKNTNNRKPYSASQKRNIHLVDVRGV